MGTIKKGAKKATKATPAKATKPQTRAAVAPPPIELPTDGPGLYDALRAEADALAPSDVGPYRVDMTLAPTNVRAAARWLASRWSDVAAHLPLLDRAALASLPALVVATNHAATLAEVAQPTERVVSERLSKARALRKKLLPVLRGLAASGLVPEAEVDAIERGRGPRDAADDCVAIPACFRRHAAAIAGKHAATDADLDACAELGAFLKGALKGERTKSEPAPPPTAAVAARNRLAALLQARHALARKAAYYFEGDAFDDAVPALNAHKGSPAAPAPASPPAGPPA